MGLKEEDFTIQKLTQAELNEVIRKHQMFLTAKPGGARAVVRDRDLTGLSFVGQNLSQSDFTGCILTHADLTNANFESATLFGCDFNYAQLHNTRLVRADMRGSEIAAANLTRADLTGADLREGKTIIKRKIKRQSDLYSKTSEAGSTVFSGSNLTGAILTGAVAIGANFSDAVLHDVKMSGANLKGAALKGTDLSNVDLSHADLREADFSYAILTGANLDKVEKGGTNFTLTLTGDKQGEDIMEFEMTLDEIILKHMSWVASGGRNGKQIVFNKIDMRNGPSLAAKRLTAAKATETTFAEMDLRGLEMQGAHLEKSDFRKCQMQNTDLRGSNFRETLFNWADLSKANLNPLSFKKQDGIEYHVPCNFEKASMRHVVFAGARLMEAKFKGADLSFADFTNCDLRKADFTSADTTGAKFDDAAIDGARFDKKEESA